jgi:ABC-2 type transport system permease protein
MLLIWPFLLKIKNILKHSTLSAESVIRFILALGFSSLIPIFLYRGMLWVLAKANGDPTLSTLPPSLFLGMMFGFLQLILLIPALFLALGNYYISEDLELILASPISFSKFFFGRLIGVLVGSSWMPFIFIFPVLFAFSSNADAPILFLIQSAIILFPFFVIPCCLAIVLGTLMTYLMPSHRARYVSHILFLAMLGAIALIAQNLDFGWSSNNNSKDLFKILKFFEIGQNSYLPSTWAAKSLELCLDSYPTFNQHTLLLYYSMFAALALGYLSILCFHPKAYSKSKSRNFKSTRYFKIVGVVTSAILDYFPIELKAFVKKDFKILARDIGQTIQLLVLSVLALMYLYNIRIFAVLDNVPETMATWWRTFLFLGNLCMGAFLTTSICTRLIFPSISLEGRALWIIQSAPLEIMSLMKAKLHSWLLPVGIISLLFFVSGATAIGGSLSTIIISGLLSIVMCYGIVGLAVGLGAYFARFDWEHPSQLSAGLGTMLFMIAAISLVFINMLPAWFILAGNENFAPIFGLSLNHAVVILILCCIEINLVAVRIAFGLGHKKLSSLGKL